MIWRNGVAFRRPREFTQSESMNHEPGQPIPEGWNEGQVPNPDEPPVIYFPTASAAHTLQVGLNQSWSRLQMTLHEKAYGAPRVFDLFTLMSVTLAFGLLFGMMKAMDAQPEVFISVTSFVTLVAVAQMMLFGGNSPRLASLIGGPLAFACVFVGLGVWYQTRAASYLGVVCLLPLAVPFGYLSGGLIAGVFLIADQLRAKFTRVAAADDSNSDSPWS